MKLVKRKLTDELKGLIYQGFEEHAIESTGASEIGEPIACCIQDLNNNVISAVVYQTFWGSLHIKYVWTHKNHRGRGLASQLMEEAFSFAKAEGYPFAFVETMNFQAPEFYKKHGFDVEFIREGYSRGTSFYYMRKDFNLRQSQQLL